MTCYSPLKGYEHPKDGIVFKRMKEAGKAIDVACGQCMGCRIDKSKEWAARIVHESQMHEENTFVTLTYDQQHLPHDGSLNKEHFQKFMKRLRRQNQDKTIRYFHCGEYGDKLSRPHYHACIFGIDFDDKEPYRVDNDIITYTSLKLEQLWGKGFCSLGELNYQTAAYTSRYIMKKVTGKKAEEHYMRVDPTTGEIYNLEPEYVTMSLKPGIGYEWYQKYKTDVFPSDECPVPGRGVYKSVPKYYDTLLEREDEDTYRTIKKLRRKYHASKCEDFTPRRLEDQYKVKKAQVNMLKRGYENGQS